MKENIGFTDSFIRFILAIALVLMNIDGAFHGIWVGITLLLAVIFLVTALISWCPIWSAFGIRTKK
jgi:hypothetical protein